MKSCNTKKREPKRKTFKLIKKKPTVAEEFFSKSTSHWRPFFSSIMHDSRRARTLNSPSLFHVRDILWQRNDTNIKGKAADFFGRFYWPAGKQALQRMPPVKHLFCLRLRFSFLLIPKYSYVSYLLLCRRF